MQEQEQHIDSVYTATTEDGTVSMVAATTTALVRETARRHELSPIATVALGRLATGATLFGAGLKGRERISLQISGDGPLASLTAETALAEGEEIGTRAYARSPQVEIDPDELGVFPISAAVGRGRMQVIKSYEIGQPHVGIVDLQSGEIDDDLAGYLQNSQQIPGVVSLDVLVRDGVTLAAGGLIAQVMPNADESTFPRLQERIARMPDIAVMLHAGATPRDVMDIFMEKQPLRSFGSFSVSFTCRCTRDKVETALSGLGREELMKMALEEERTEAICDFCRRAYYFNPHEIIALAGKLHRRG